VAANPAALINLVAIEAVIEVLLQALREPGAGLRTLQITGAAFCISDLARAITSALDLDGVQLVAPEAFEHTARNPLEAHFQRMTQVYTPYLFHAPRFAPGSFGERVPVDPTRLTVEFVAQLAPRGVPRKAQPMGELALATLGIARPQDYFDGLVRGTVGRHFLARHEYVDAVIEFNLRGTHACAVALHFADGVVRVGDAQGRADCRYELDSALFMRIIAGEKDLRAAFLAGHVQIFGNKELALKFGALLGFYYRNLDDHVIEEMTA
jgi:putative sterol carrier protein